MFAKFNSLWELHKQGTFDQLTTSAQGLIQNIPILEINRTAINEQSIIAILGIVIIGIIFHFINLIYHWGAS